MLFACANVEPNPNQEIQVWSTKTDKHYKHATDGRWFVLIDDVWKECEEPFVDAKNGNFNFKEVVYI